VLTHIDENKRKQGKAMDFIDWRKAPEKNSTDTSENVGRKRGRRYQDYIEELIQEAQERGEFSNLQGSGKPLALDDNPYTGDKTLAYHILKSNGYAPPEIELANEIRKERERAEAKLKRITHQGKFLRSRRVAPFASEKRTFNSMVEKAASEYATALRELNRKILTLNLTAPAAMHQTFLEVEPLVQQFLQSNPLFEDVRNSS
jgi:DnaJ homolog subfamily C member 28